MSENVMERTVCEEPACGDAAAVDFTVRGDGGGVGDIRYCMVHAEIVAPLLMGAYRAARQKWIASCEAAKALEEQEMLEVKERWSTSKAALAPKLLNALDGDDTAALMEVLKDLTAALYPLVDAEECGCVPF